MSHPGGRPTNYDPKYCEQIIEYFSVPPYVEREKTIVSQGEKFEVPVIEANDMPTFAGFACSIGVHRETLINWCKVHPEFFDAYKKAKEFQEHFIIVNGNKGLINTAFGIFTAKNVLGWKDRQPEEVPQITNVTETRLTKEDVQELHEKTLALVLAQGKKE